MTPDAADHVPLSESVYSAAQIVILFQVLYNIVLHVASCMRPPLNAGCTALETRVMYKLRCDQQQNTVAAKRPVKYSISCEIA